MPFEKKRKPVEEKEEDGVVNNDPIASLSDLLVIGDKGRWFYKGRELTKQEKDNLKSEADIIARTSLWKIIVTEGKYHSQKRAMIDAKTGDNEKDMSTLRGAQAYHEVIMFLAQFISNINKK